jgi:hypothetical protein
LFSQFDIQHLAGDERRRLAAYFAAHHGEELSIVPKSLHDIDTYVKIVQLKADARYRAWSSDDCYFEAARLIRQVEQEHKKQQKTQLTDQLRQAEADGNDALAAELMNELNQLIKEIARGR